MFSHAPGCQLQTLLDKVGAEVVVTVGVNVELTFAGITEVAVTGGKP